MKRKITAQLLEWKNRPHKPLIVNGARQVGKSYIIEEFGKQYYENCIKVNLDLDSNVRNFFNSDITPANIVQFLEIFYRQKITPGKTLIFLDEIQASKRALLSLKYFNEQAPEYDIIAAGSLLGVAIAQDKKEEEQEYSYPVGNVEEFNMYPMDFEEFIWAQGNDLLAAKIREHFISNKPFDETMHNFALSLYTHYLIVGGMPESVKVFAATGSYLDAQNVQRSILEQYVKDTTKYAEPSTAVKIRACYNSMPAQLAKENRKFQYKVVKKGGTSTIFGESIEWLVQAGIVLKCNLVSNGNIPLAAGMDLSDFKLYMSDVGLLTVKSEFPVSLLLSPIEVNNTFVGAIAENYVAQHLAAKGYNLYYWKNNNTAEVDFILQSGADIVPVEVKKGIRVHSRSMMMFMNSYKCKTAIRISKKNFGLENGIKSVPVYSVFCV